MTDEFVHCLNRTIYQGCSPSATFRVALVVATSSAPDCCNQALMVVPRNRRLNPPKMTYSMCCRRICSGGSLRQKMFHAPSNRAAARTKCRYRPPAIKPTVLMLQRQKRANICEWVGTSRHKRYKLSARGKSNAGSGAARRAWTKWFWPAIMDGLASAPERPRPETQRRRRARATSARRTICDWPAPASSSGSNKG